MNRKNQYWILYSFVNICADLIYLYSFDPFNSNPSPNSRVPYLTLLISILQTLISVALYCPRNQNYNFFAYRKPCLNFKKVNRVSLSLSINMMTIFVLITLLGAPLRDWSLTFCLSLAITFLSILPHLIRPLSKSSLFDLPYLDSPVALQFYSTIIGAWFGAFLLKLDWIVAWKEYPSAILISTIIFNALSHFGSIAIQARR